MVGEPQEEIEEPPIVLGRYRISDFPALLAAVSTSIDHLRPWLAWASADPLEPGLIEFIFSSIEGFDRGDNYDYGRSQQSVIIPPEAGAKFRQSLLFGSQEWHDIYATLKDAGREALDDPGRRRVNGTAAQSIMTELLLLAANVRKIRTFLDDAAARDTAPEHSRPRPRRRRTRSVEAWRPRSGVAAGAFGPNPL